MNLKATVIFAFCLLSILASSFFVEEQNSSAETSEFKEELQKERIEADSELVQK